MCFQMNTTLSFVLKLISCPLILHSCNQRKKFRQFNLSDEYYPIWFLMGFSRCSPQQQCSIICYGVDTQYLFKHYIVVDCNASTAIQCRCKITNQNQASIRRILLCRISGCARCSISISLHRQHNFARISAGTICRSNIFPNDRRKPWFVHKGST